MKKKLVSVLLSATMVATMIAGCGKTDEVASTETTVENTEATSDTQAAEPAPDASTGDVVAEEIPAPVYYYSFDAADDSASIQPTVQDTGASPILQPIEKEKKYIPGVKGDCLYTDGVTGYTLKDIKGVGSVYTISYWTYCKRCALYMPNAIWGPDIHGDFEDVTGGELWAGLDWLSGSDEGTNCFPSVWSNDGAGVGRAEWSIAESDEGIGRWMNITLVVDENNTTADGAYAIGQIYIDGKEYVRTKSGEVDTIEITKGAMTDSEHFEFLLGINYWDKVFKGGYDELYVFDQALTAGQALSLYQMGDPTVAFEEPERIIEVKAADNAMESLGTIDQTNEFASQWSQAYGIEDGQTIQITLNNWSDGKDSKNNYAMMFTTSDDAAATYADASYEALVYADATAEKDNVELTYDWGNWNTWTSSVMVEVTTTFTINRTGNVITVKADNVDYNGASNIMNATITTAVADDATCNLFFTAGNCYVDILSCKDMTANVDGVVVGNTDRSTGWWTAFSDIWAVAEGESKTVSFINYTSGIENWHNFVAILQSTPEGHGAEVEGYSEYAVVRADNFGWGAGYDGIVTPECDWNWDTFKEDMDGAKVDLTVTNNGTTADVVAVVTTQAGTVYTQKYNGIEITGDLYFCLGCEGAYLVLPATVVGNTDRSTGWWTAFSDIWAVAEGTTKTVNFTNYTSGIENWHNFVAILQNTPEGHGAEVEGYAEYAVVRADNFGWGVGYDGIVTPECDWNWDTFKEDMDGADVSLSVTNNGTTADVVAVVTTQAGTVYTQKYNGIEITGDLYFCLGCEGSYLVVK